jgi:hypothetical protein
MSGDEIRKLLGGYATGTLTSEERQALFEAALDDQELFDALAREQPLRELLGDPAARAELLAALGDAPAPWRERWARWMRGHAVGLAAAACLLAVGIYTVRMARFNPQSAPETATARPAESAKPERVFEPKAAETSAPQPVLKASPPVLVARNATPAVPPAAAPTPSAPPPAMPAPMASAAMPAPMAPMTPVAPMASPAEPGPGAIAGALGFLPRASGAAAGGFGAGARGGFGGGRGGAGAVPAAGAPAAPVPMRAAASASASMLSGTLTDSSGAAVPGAQVELKNLATGAVRNTVSGPEGIFVFNSLTPSRYTLTARAAGFKTVLSENLEVAAGAPVSLGKMQMPLGALTEEVSVTAEATPVQTASSEKSTLADSSQMTDLTLKGRDLFATLQTVPGATSGNTYLTGGNATSESAALQSARAVGGAAGAAVGGLANITVNGIADMDTGTNGTVSFAPLLESKLDPSLVALIGHARSGAKLTSEESRFVSKGAALVRLTLTGASAPTLAQLKSAGFGIKSRKGNEVTGRVAIDKLQPLARLPFVVRIAPGK